MPYNNTTIVLDQAPIQHISNLSKHLDQLARSALYDEVSLELKPGLVCPSSQGSHYDMNHALFIKSITSLKGYYAQLCEYAFHDYAFEDIQQAGIKCEQRMLLATNQINTHKGAIFNLGFASAGVGRCLSLQLPINSENICKQIQLRWQQELLNKLDRNPNSHGQQMRKKYGISGAIEQVAYGFDIVQRIALPCFQSTLAQTQSEQHAALQCLMILISQLPDTNIVWRGGMSALFIVQEMAQKFIHDGGVLQTNWEDKLKKINQYFIKHRLSPGGSADLLGVTLFFHKVEHEFCCNL